MYLCFLYASTKRVHHTADAIDLGEFFPYVHQFFPIRCIVAREGDDIRVNPPIASDSYGPDGQECALYLRRHDRLDQRIQPTEILRMGVLCTDDAYSDTRTRERIPLDHMRLES